jgi:predicted class III extradiol MEMO1 family dioxygenase
MSKRRAGKAGSWYTSNAAQLDAQLTEWAALPALVPPGAALRACAHHLLHLHCSALESALQPPALATEGAAR